MNTPNIDWEAIDAKLDSLMNEILLSNIKNDGSGSEGGEDFTDDDMSQL